MATCCQCKCLPLPVLLYVFLCTMPMSANLPIYLFVSLSLLYMVSNHLQLLIHCLDEALCPISLFSFRVLGALDLGCCGLHSVPLQQTVETASPCCFMLQPCLAVQSSCLHLQCWQDLVWHRDSIPEELVLQLVIKAAKIKRKLQLQFFLFTPKVCLS